MQNCRAEEFLLNLQVRQTTPWAQRTSLPICWVAGGLWPKLWAWRLLSTRPQSRHSMVRPALGPDIACASLTLIGQSQAVKRTRGHAQGTKSLVAMTMPTEGVRSLCLTSGKMYGTPGAAQIVMSEGSVRIIVRDQTFQCLRTSSVATEAARPGKLEGWHKNLASEDRRSTCSMTRPMASLKQI